MNTPTRTGLEILIAAAVIGMAAMLSLSCQANVGTLASNVDSNIVETSTTAEEIQVPSPPTTDEVFNIHSKIGIADVRDGGTGCLRTKNGDLAERTPVSVIISLNELPQRILNATVEKKVEKSCARYASESGDNNPGDNFFYSLTFDGDKVEEFGFDNGIAVISPQKQIQIQNGLAVFDLDEDGKPEYFRRCTGFEGTHFTLWTGKPLKGKRIWHSFYYVDYDTEPNCKDMDLKETGVN